VRSGPGCSFDVAFEHGQHAGLHRPDNRDVEPIVGEALQPPWAEGLDYESYAVGLDRNELGALLVAAGLGPPGEHALISLLALNGLRVSEATGADIEALGVERGHRTLVVTRKGGKVVTIPLPAKRSNTRGSGHRRCALSR
jgi:integrase